MQAISSVNFLQFRAQMKQENEELERFMREMNKLLPKKTLMPAERALSLSIAVPMAPLQTYSKENAQKDQVTIQVEQDSVALQVAEEVLQGEDNDE
jgi:hypothetical protein